MGRNVSLEGVLRKVNDYIDDNITNSELNTHAHTIINSVKDYIGGNSDDTSYDGVNDLHLGTYNTELSRLSVLQHLPAEHSYTPHNSHSQRKHVFIPFPAQV